jgi:hypothetical protein
MPPSIKNRQKGDRARDRVGFHLPDLTIYSCASQNIPNVALMVYDLATSLIPQPIILLGPKMWTPNPMVPGTAAGLEGGLGQLGARGVANQVYDGTQRFFGNPKQNAQATTIVVHEFGHLLHEVTNPGVFWAIKDEIQNGILASAFDPNWGNIATQVSHYATHNALEFVAETFAGRRSGKNYGLAVTNTYAALAGP